MSLVQHNDIVRYFLVTVIFYFANTTAFHYLYAWLEIFERGSLSQIGLQIGFKLGCRSSLSQS